MTVWSEELRRMGEVFRRFGELECPALSPLYERLSLGIAEDPDLLGIALARRAGQPAPNLLFAAVHWLLLEGSGGGLAASYPDLTPEPDRGDPLTAFRSFCLERKGEIEGIISTRAVQTNVVRRSALLLPGFARGLADSGGRPVYLVEVGASAGLNLLWDRYHYDYGDGLEWGDEASPVRLTTVRQGEERLPMSAGGPVVAGRVGLDLEPVSLDEPESVAWLRALVWPERRDEARLLEAAMELARAGPPTLLAGDAVELLPGALESVPEDALPCIFHSHTLNQFPPDGRERFGEIVREFGRRRDLSLVSLEGRLGQENSELDLLTYRAGARRWEHLATCDSHGYRIRWLPDS